MNREERGLGLRGFISLRVITFGFYSIDKLLYVRVLYHDIVAVHHQCSCSCVGRLFETYHYDSSVLSWKAIVLLLYFYIHVLYRAVA